MSVSRILAALGAAIALPASGQALYKCVADGKTSYQAEPCGPRARQSEIAAPRPAPVPPQPEAGSHGAEGKAAPNKGEAGDPSGDVELVVDTFLGYTLCSEADPGFGARHAFGFDGWKERNAALLQRFNQDAEGPRRLQQRLQEERRRQQSDPGAARASRIETCARIASRVKPLRQKP